MPNLIFHTKLSNNMTHESMTNTTSFIINSDESLNKLPLSAAQPTGSSESVKTNECSHQSPYFGSPSPVNNYDNMVSNQHQPINGYRSSSSLPPPPPPPPSYTSNDQKTNVAQPAAGTVMKQQLSNLESQFNNMPYQPANIGRNLCETTPDSNNYSIYDRSNHSQSMNLNEIRATHPITPNTQLYIQKSNDQTLDLNLSPQNRNQIVNGNSQNSPTCNTNYSDQSPPKASPPIQSFHQSNKKFPTYGQRSSVSLNSSTSNSLMPLNAKSMLLHGVSDREVLKTWLNSIDCEDYLPNFVENGYDMPLLTRMTPQDLSAIGCKSPALRKKLLVEIKKLNLEDDIPEWKPPSLDEWLRLLKLSEYYHRLCDEGYETIDKVCQLTWEDLEDIGIHRLGHQKRLLLGIERVRKFNELAEMQRDDCSIYDVHPNHRISLKQIPSDGRLRTLNRSTMRPGFFQTRSGASLEYRGLPVATVIPAVKQMNNLANFDLSQRVVVPDERQLVKDPSDPANRQSIVDSDPSNPTKMFMLGEPASVMSDTMPTMKRNHPPLPPVRTNSLKVPQDTGARFDDNIYGNYQGTLQRGNGCSINLSQTTGSTTFLRTPKLGTLTATTNKMLTLGGHIQTVNIDSTIMRPIMPIREAPPPPPSMPLSDRIVEHSDFSMNSSPSFESTGPEGSTVVSASFIGQLASADEFPPPPPQ